MATVITFTQVIFETPNFTFECFAETPTKASQLLQEAWKLHCKEYPLADPNYLFENRDDIQVRPLRMGIKLRDGEEMIQR